MAKRQYVIIDRREANLRYERRVFIIPPNGRELRIDPRQEIEVLTLAYLGNRDGCVIGMADGFQSAGVKIAITNCRYGFPAREFHVRCHPSVPIYWFLGYALAQNRWEHIKRVVQVIPVAQRFHIYESSALEFMGRRLGQQADLIAPVGLLVR